MTRKDRKTLIGAYALLRIRAEEGEKLARALVPQDIGATTRDRHAGLAALQKHTERFAKEAALVLQGIEEAIGATAILDRARFPRAKPISRGSAP